MSSSGYDRVANLDLLRVISMLLIILLHSIDHSGVLEAVPRAGLCNFLYVRILYMITQVSVNIYVMLSGYFLVLSTFKIEKLIRLWMEVVFYSLVLKLIFMLTGSVPFSIPSLISCFVPIFTGRYWFVTIYVGMYLLSPFLNIAIKAMDKRTHGVLNILLCVLFSLWNSIWPSFAGMNSGGGWGLAWFVVLYFVAAWLRLYYVPTDKYIGKLLIWIGISIGTAALYCIGGMYSSAIRRFAGNLYKYESFAAYLSTVAVFIGFLNIRIKKHTKCISALAASTFGVYLIHAHANLSPWIWGRLDLPSFMGSWHFAFIQIASVIFIFVMCTLLDFVRKKTVGRVEKWNGVEIFAKNLENILHIPGRELEA